jgi:ATP-dependent Clp protease ATP-binding subunit ClpC
VFERFTERARQVVVLAQEEARATNSAHITVPLMFAGLIREEEGLAARVLASLGVQSVDQFRDLIMNDGEKRTGQIPFTPNAKKVIEISLREALALGHNYIGTEHLLLAISRADVVAGDGLLDLWERHLSLDPDQVRADVMRMLEPPRGRTMGHTEEPETQSAWEVTVTPGDVVNGQTIKLEFAQRPTFDINNSAICFEAAGGPLLVVVPDPGMTITMKQKQ